MLFLFQGQIFQILLSQKLWDLVQTCVIRSFYIFIFAIELRRCKSCTTPWPWPSVSRSNIWNDISEMARAGTKMSIMTLIDFTCAIEWNHYSCNSHTLWPWPKFSKLTLQMVTKLFLRICLHLYGICGRAALVILLIEITPFLFRYHELHLVLGQ